MPEHAQGDPPVPLPHRLVAHLRAHSFPCPQCGYDLKGLSRPLCPECGRTATEADLDAPQRPPWLRFALSPWGWAGVAGLEVVATLWNDMLPKAKSQTLGSTFVGPDGWPGMAAVLCGGLFVTWVLLTATGRRGRKADRLLLFAWAYHILLIVAMCILTAS